MQKYRVIRKQDRKQEIRTYNKLNLKLIYNMVTVQNTIYKSCCIDFLLPMNGHG